jgi:hypothetical protein
MFFQKQIFQKQQKFQKLFTKNHFFNFTQSQTWITRSFHILDSENKGYLTKTEILQMLE